MPIIENLISPFSVLGLLGRLLFFLAAVCSKEPGVLHSIQKPSKDTSNNLSNCQGDGTMEESLTNTFSDYPQNSPRNETSDSFPRQV